MTSVVWNRRQFVSRAISAAALVSIFSPAARAQHNLSRIVIGFPPGGVVDIMSRRIGDALQGNFAKAVVIENKTGAGGQIAAVETMRAVPDGTTLLYTPSSIVTIYPHIYKRLPYDPKVDLTPASIGGLLIPALAVGPSVPATVTTVPELMAWIKDNPSQASYGSPAAGSSVHFIGMMLSQASGAKMNHVAYRGTQPALLDLVAGRIPIVISTQGEFLPMQKAGTIRVLAVGTPNRSKALPDVPTLLEQGYKDIVVRDFLGFFLPKDTPPSVVAETNAALHEAMAKPAVLKAMQDTGVEPATSSAAELEALVRSETEKWRDVVKQSGFSAD
jgi:tripartite-type tricarboxylate transporter receptor subunit TctC